MTTPQRYLSSHNEPDLDRYGDSHSSVGYTRTAEEATSRYALMLDVIRERDEPVSLLDVGCGLAHLLDHIQATGLEGRVAYSGVDISPKYLAAAKARHPDADIRFGDILADGAAIGEFDYVICNGLFNHRGVLTFDEMSDYWRRMTVAMFAAARRGLAFNVMSKLVQWERDDLFHLPFDALAAHVGGAMSRHFVIRHDYEAYEYTTYVYRSPSGL